MVTPKLPFRVLIHKLDGSFAIRPKTHCLLRVTLQDRSVYALDLTGAQYGFHQTITPWSEYVSLVVKEVVAIKPFKTISQAYKMQHLLKLVGVGGATNEAPDRAAQIAYRLHCLGESLEEAPLLSALAIGANAVEILKMSRSEYAAWSVLWLGWMKKLLQTCSLLNSSKDRLADLRKSGEQAASRLFARMNV